MRCSQRILACEVHPRRVGNILVDNVVETRVLPLYLRTHQSMDDFAEVHEGNRGDTFLL
jgi:hypothetical protein